MLDNAKRLGRFLLHYKDSIASSTDIKRNGILDALFELEFQTVIDSGYKANPELEIDPNLPKPNTL